MKMIIVINIIITILSMKWIMTRSTIITINDEEFYKLIKSYGYNIKEPNIIIGYVDSNVWRKEKNIKIILIGKENKKIKFKFYNENEIASYIGSHSNLGKYIIIYNLIVYIISIIMIIVYI